MQTAAIDINQVKEQLLEVARQCLVKGPGYAQEGVVLRETQEKMGISKRDVDHQQLLLTCWHELFREGKLSWGYNIDNPNAPFFHIPKGSV